MSTVGKAQDRKQQDYSIIALDKFIQATRDSGYKGTASAISELVDNSIQAGATRIASPSGQATDDEDKAIEVSVLDNGCGMDPATLRQALRFGGSTRFGDRTDSGATGWGSPTLAEPGATGHRLHVAGVERRAARASRSRSPRVYSSYLDVDEIVPAR